LSFVNSLPLSTLASEWGVQQLTTWQMRREVMDLPAYSNGGSAVRMAWTSSGWPSAYGQALNPDVRDARGQQEDSSRVHINGFGT
jgi:hypothetical protein